MSPRRKSNHSRKTRAGSKDTRVVVASDIRKDPPDYKHLARALLLTAKEMQEARELGISVEELRRSKAKID